MHYLRNQTENYCAGAKHTERSEREKGEERESRREKGEEREREGGRMKGKRQWIGEWVGRLEEGRGKGAFTGMDELADGQKMCV